MKTETSSHTLKLCMLVELCLLNYKHIGIQQKLMLLRMQGVRVPHIPLSHGLANTGFLNIQECLEKS